MKLRKRDFNKDAIKDSNASCSFCYYNFKDGDNVYVYVSSENRKICDKCFNKLEE